jgi:hypothetical protein
VREIVPAREGTQRPAFWIRDLESLNGTKLSGGELAPGQPKKLRPGDIVRLSKGEGHCDLLVHCDM